MKKILVSLMVLGFVLVSASFANAQLTKSASVTSIKSTAVTARTLMLGSKGDDVKKVQQSLIDQGFLFGKADGSMGKNTVDALKKFQIKNKLTVDGKCGPKVQELLLKNTTNKTVAVTSKSLQQNLAPTSACSITVTSPNGGEVFTAGQQVMMTWTSNCPTTDFIQVRLYNQAGMGINISPVTPNLSGSTYVANDGSEMMTIPTPTYGTATAYGLHFKVRMIDGYSGGVNDYSNNMFTINQATATCGNLTYAMNSAYPSTSATPNTTHFKIGSFVLQNQNSCEAIRVTNLNVTLATGGTMVPLTDLSNLSAYINGSIAGMPINPAVSNSFAPSSFILAPGTSTIVDVYADLGATASGTINTGLVPTGYGTSTNNQYPLGGGITTVVGQLITIGTATLNTPTLITSASTPSEYVASANGATDATQATYNFSATGGVVNISELKFTVTGPNTVSSIKVNGISVPVVSGVAYLMGLNIPVPNGGSGVNINALVSYPAVGIAGVPSGTTSQIALTYVKYTSGGTTTVITPNVTAPMMMLVGSKPSVLLTQPTSSTLVNGVVELAKVTVTADPQGNISLQNIPLAFNANGSVSIPNVLNSLKVFDSNGTMIPTTNTAFSVTGGSVATSVISFQNPYLISAGTSQVFSIRDTVSVSGAPMTAFIQTFLWANISNFSWLDVAGGNTTPFTNLNSGYFSGWPTNASTIYN